MIMMTDLNFSICCCKLHIFTMSQEQGEPQQGASHHEEDTTTCVEEVCLSDHSKTNKNILASAQTNSLNNCQDNCTDGSTADGSGFSFTNIPTTDLENLRRLNEQFIKDRNWHQFHSPRNVLLALVGEVGELAEIFQWKGEVSEGLPELSQAERDHVGQEVSDILIYLIDFASRCHIDLPSAVANKMAANALKYPTDKAYGKANKYTDYQ